LNGAFLSLKAINLTPAAQQFLTCSKQQDEKHYLFLIRLGKYEVVLHKNTLKKSFFKEYPDTRYEIRSIEIRSIEIRSIEIRNVEMKNTGIWYVKMKKNVHSLISRTSTEYVILKIYSFLLDSYGPQGWWPLIELHDSSGTNPAKTGSVRGYHPGDYTYPHTDSQQFEIICGALLTQNTSWQQVERALINLRQINSLSPEAILSLDPETLKEAIKPAGYYNQKAARIKTLAEWFLELKSRIPQREELLSLKGVGPETADSVLLYAFKQPSFVVDAYTRRVVSNLGLADEKAKYSEIKALFEENLPKDLAIYQEYHALLVEHAKRYYQKKASYSQCPLLRSFLD
jgi:endonuclease-3 related protein